MEDVWAGPRVCWLPGGLAAISDVGQPYIVSAGVGGEAVTRRACPRYHDLLPSLIGLGLYPLTCSVTCSEREALGVDPPDFRVMLKRRPWLLSELHQRWREVANAAVSQQAMDLSDTAARIAFEISAVEVRLLELAEAYGRQLRGKHSGRDWKAGKRFEDLNTRAVIFAIHALFGELAVLRDTLSEFVGVHSGIVALPKGKRVAKLSTLLPLLPAADHPLATYIATSASREGGGWLAELTAYRNLFTHVSPLPYVGHRFLVLTEDRALADGTVVPSIYFPLPAKPIDLERERSQGYPFKTFDEWVQASASFRPERSLQPDALEYLHGKLEQMAELIERVLVVSPIAPKPIELGPNDIIGGVRVV